MKGDGLAAVSRGDLPPEVRELADRAFSRAAGAPLLPGNRVRILRDARENYPAWLEAIGSARRRVHLENYIIRADRTGARFAEALLERARAGVEVRVLYDVLGCIGTPRRFWRRLREGGIEVRGYNPPAIDRPLGWLSRDHRKSLTVDGRVGFVTGLCIGEEWEGDAAAGCEPWRDTGVEVRGAAVAEVERAFARTWAASGGTLPPPESAGADDAETEVRGEGGHANATREVSVRVVAGEPATAGLFRLDQLVAALARERLWLTDAYYAGTASYTQALRALARDGVDVRLLVPGATDIPLLRPLSRAGYRALLEAGVRVFEWNGSMLHAKTAVADGLWARVGSSNLNLASWLGNYELDVVVEDRDFAGRMEDMYREDLARSTEVVLDRRRRLCCAEPSRGERLRWRPSPGRHGGRMNRAAAGAMRAGSAVGAAVTGRRVLESVEARTAAVSGAALLALAALFAVFPRVAAWPLAAVLAWFGGALVYRSARLRMGGRTDLDASDRGARSGVG